MEYVVVTIPLPDEVVKVPGVPPSNTGGGNVDSVNHVLPDGSKNVQLTPANIGAEVAGAAATAENNAKAYADALVVGLWDDRGNYNASTNLFPAAGGSGPDGAILKGDIWTISVAGNDTFPLGATIRALTDLPGQTAGNWVITETNLGYQPENPLNKKTIATNSATDYLAGVALYDALVAILAASQLIRAGRRMSAIYTTLGAGSGWTANSWRAIPFLQTKTLVSIGVEVTGAVAGGKARCVIFLDSNFYPSALVADGGELDCSTTGIKDGVINLPSVDKPRWIWLCCNINNGAIGFRYITSNVNLIGRTSASGNNPMSMYNATGVTYGAPPSTYPAGAIERAFQQEGILIEVTS